MYGRPRGLVRRKTRSNARATCSRERLRRGVVEERRRVVEDREVARLPEVARGHERQPEQVVGHPRDVPLLGERVPPVVDRAVGELVRRVEVDLLAAARRARSSARPASPGAGRGSRRRRSAGSSRSGPRCGRDRLVAHPVVGQVVERGVRRLDAVRGEAVAPAGADVGERARRSRSTLAVVSSSARRPPATSPRRRGRSRGRGARPAAARPRTRSAAIGSSCRPKSRCHGVLRERLRRRGGRRSGRGKPPCRPRPPVTGSVQASALTYGKLGVPVPVAPRGDLPHVVAGEDRAAARRRARSRGRACGTRAAATAPRRSSTRGRRRARAGAGGR